MPFLGQDLSDPQTAAILALSGNMVRGDFGGGLLGASTAYQGAQEGPLKRQDLAQQIQLRNIQLQQQQQEWAAIQPALADYIARRSGQGGTAPSASASPSQPALSPSPGGPLGSGTFGIPMGGQPASSAPAQVGAPSQVNDPFGIDNVIQSKVLGLVGGKNAEATFWKQFEPTDLQRNDRYLGVTQEQSRAAELAKRAKEGYIPPTRLGNAGYFDATKGFVPTPAAPLPGFINVPDATDPSGFRAVQIGGGTAAVADAAEAKTSGEGRAIPYAGVDSKGNPLPVTNRTAAATQGRLGAPTPAPAQDAPPMPPAQADARSTPTQRASTDVVSIQNEIKRVNGSLVAAPIKKMQLDILNQELAKAQAQAGAPVQPAAPASAVYAAPPLGTVKNADTSQNASAQTMHDSYASLQAANASAQPALDSIDKMLDLSKKKWPYFQAGPLGTKTTMISPDAAEYEKHRANLITMLAQQNGTNTSDAGRALQGDAVPDFGKPQAAQQDGLGQLRNQVVLKQIKTNLLTPVFQAGDSKKYTELQNQFDQNIAPSMIPLLTMPAGPQRAAALKAAAQNPTMKARLNWAAENGLLK